VIRNRGSDRPSRPRQRRRAALVAATGVVAFVLASGAVASAAWIAAGSGRAYSAAQTVNAGSQPTASAAGSSVTVSWTASTISGGAAVGGYTIKRYTSGGVLQTTGANCSGTIAGLTCTELNVPNGTWQYSVTPVRDNWVGTESPKRSVTVATPTVTSVSPSSRGQGATSQSITITGTNFVSGAVASFSGTGITVNSTTFNSSTSLTANVGIATGAATGVRNVTVTNPDTGTGTCTSCFTVNAGPMLTSTSPSSLDQGATSQTVSVVGTGFVSGATVSFSGTGITVNSTAFTDSSHLSLNVTLTAGATLGARDVTVTNPDAGKGTGTGAFTVVKITATSTSPSALARGATQNVSVIGTNFVSGATVLFSGTGITLNSTTFVDASHLTANVTIGGAATSGARNVTVTNPDAIAATCTGCFTVDTAVPTVTSATPSSRGQGATNQSITIAGTNFVSGAAVSFSGAGITVNSTTFNSVTSLTANVSVAAGAATGARNVTVTNPDFGSGTRNSAFTVNAGPTVTSTSPSSLDQGATSQTVSVVGTGFVSGATVSFSGTGITINSTTFTNSTHLTLSVTVAGGAALGARDVTVTNPDAGTGTGSGVFTVAKITVTSISPTALGQGATNQNVSIVGTNFVNGATFSGSGPSVGGITLNSTTFVDSSHITVNVSIAANAPTGVNSLTLTNPDGIGATCTNCFTIDVGPTVTSTSPSSLARGATGQTVTVVGTNFVSGATAAFSGTGITINSTTFTNSTHLTLNVTIAAGAATGARNVAVTNPDAGTGTGTGVFTVT
jgi:hypothetical protein